MKRIVLLVLLALACVRSVPAVRYQGFLESYFGAFIPSNFYHSGPAAGFATSHGIEICPGLFVGLGGDLLFCSYSDSYRNLEKEVNSLIQFNTFLEGRYCIFPSKKATPYVDLRLGISFGRFEYSDKKEFPYLSPGVGYSFNLSRKYGFDLGVGYAYYGNAKISKHYASQFYPHKYFKVANNSLHLRVGFHF